MAKLEIYWSFRSPYSYLATDRLCEIAEDYAVNVDFRPVRPLAMREPDFFERNRPQFLPYLINDAMREAQRLGIAFGHPNPDPIDMNLGTGVVAKDQPIMDRVMALGIAACEKGKGLAFGRAVSRRIWGGQENWNCEENLAAVASEAGLDFTALAEWVRDNTETIENKISDNEAAQLIHHWGVPLMVLDDEPFFGQDRLDSVFWRLDQKGLRKQPGD